MNTARAFTLEEALDVPKAELASLYRQHVNPDLCSLLALVGFDRRFVEAHGVTVTDDCGREYLDFLGGYGSLNLGHNHPELVEALHAVDNAPNLLQASLGQFGRASWRERV